MSQVQWNPTPRGFAAKVGPITLEVYATNRRWSAEVRIPDHDKGRQEGIHSREEAQRSAEQMARAELLRLLDLFTDEPSTGPGDR